mgnify:CR=1 FL=1
MATLQLILFIIFTVLTIVGYRKNNRNLMLLGAIVVAFAFVGLDFIMGIDHALSANSE